jgi:hypothetical protein
VDSFESGRGPAEPHFDILQDTSGVRADPCLVQSENDPDLAGSRDGLVTGGLAFIQLPSVAES